VTESESLALVKLVLAHRDEYLAMADEFVAERGYYPYNNAGLARADFAAFVRELEDEAQGIDLPEGVAPQQTYLLLKDGTTVVGEIRFRPGIEPPFERHNGHVGYNIRPSLRGHGYATRQLALLLDEARRVGLLGVFLPVEGENPASVRVIEKNGGRFLRGETQDDGTPVRYYWIALGHATATPHTP
jgi:predicted acetyltransferase